MRRKTYEVLIILSFLIVLYATISVNEFASVVAAFVCIAGVICCHKLSKLPEPYWDDPQWDGTDAAHPAFWRGEEHSCNQFCRLISDVLSGKNKCKGKMYEPLETVRNSVFELKRKCERLQKQNKQQANTIGKYQNEMFLRIGNLENEIPIKYKGIIDCLRGENEVSDTIIQGLKKERRACFTTLNAEQPPICGGSNLNTQVERLINLIEKLTTERDVALEQRTADWDRIHELEKATNDLVKEIKNYKELIVQYRSNY